MNNYFDRFDFGRGNGSFSNMNFSDRFKIDRPHPGIVNTDPFNRPPDMRAMDSYFQAHARQSLLELTRIF